MKFYLEPDEVALLEEAAASLRDRLLISLLFRLGSRISEALAIRLEDVDFERSTITIQHLKTRSKLSCRDCDARLAKVHRFCPGCGRGMEKAVAPQHEHRRKRRLPVDDHTLDVIREHTRTGGLVHREGKALLFGINRHRGWQLVRD